MLIKTETFHIVTIQKALHATSGRFKAIKTADSKQNCHLFGGTSRILFQNMNRHDRVEHWKCPVFKYSIHWDEKAMQQWHQTDRKLANKRNTNQTLDNCYYVEYCMIGRLFLKFSFFMLAYHLTRLCERNMANICAFMSAVIGRWIVHVSMQPKKRDYIIRIYGLWFISMK